MSENMPWSNASLIPAWQWSVALAIAVLYMLVELDAVTLHNLSHNRQKSGICFNVLETTIPSAINVPASRGTFRSYPLQISGSSKILNSYPVRVHMNVQS